jgi:hypothetical protein
MAGYIKVTRLSRVQLSSEDRKQQAHLKKIGEMQSRSSLDTSPPPDYPHRTRHFSVQLREKNRQIEKDNDLKLKKLLSIMESKTVHPPPPYHPTSPTRRQQSLRTSQNYADYRERIANTKGTYHVREWNKGFEEHKEHLKISKDNNLFTPCDVAINQSRVRGNSIANSKRTTPSSSTMNVRRQSNNNG